MILSGTGSYGTLGLKAIKASGGMAMVQEPGSAGYDQMPQSAIASGLVDYVLPVEQMPDALVKYVQHAYVEGGQAAEVEAPDDLDSVLALLRARTRYDFRCYRKHMLNRRISRRIGLNHLHSLSEYLGLLRQNPDEVRQLSRDLLISVTSFFRDAEAYRALETDVIAPLIQAKNGDSPVRVWVPGCATGEEAYSIGILLLEQLAAARKSCQVQIFATDLDEAALNVARLGVYPATISTDVSPQRLKHWFMRIDEASYQVGKPLREASIFAVQNIIADAPFSKLDLVSCRNLLIYLEPEVQRKVVALLHFALDIGGHLFLGPAETIGRHIDLFEPVSKKTASKASWSPSWRSRSVSMLNRQFSGSMKTWNAAWLSAPRPSASNRRGFRPFSIRPATLSSRSTITT